MEKRSFGLGMIENKLDQVPEEFKELAKEFTEKGFIPLLVKI